MLDIPLENVLGSLEVTVSDISIRNLLSHERMVREPSETTTIHYVYRGTGGFGSGDERLTPISCDSLIVVPRGLRQVFDTTTGSADVANSNENDCLQIVSVQLAARFGAVLGVFDGLTEPIVEPMAAARVVRETFHRLGEECSRPDLGSRALSNVLVTQCIILLIRQLAQRDHTTAFYFAALTDTRIASALALVARTADGSPSVGAMADAAGMSKTAFARVFTATLRRSPIDFVGRARLHKAAALLQTTPLPIKAVAWQVGFASRSHFSRAFKSAYGADPSAFRRSQQTACASHFQERAMPLQHSSSIIKKEHQI